jgi:AcrR family transcriptional regulator
VSAEPSATRQKILEAAAEIARESGASNIPLEAVAARAGISKGGLLYHFPSKAKLLEGIVKFHLATFEKALKERELEKRDRANGLMEAYLELFSEENCAKEPPPSGLLAALAENPDFLAPVREHHRGMLDRLCASNDPTMAIIIFLAIQGARSMQLLNLEVLSDDEFTAAMTRLKQIAGDSQS